MWIHFYVDNAIKAVLWSFLLNKQNFLPHKTLIFLSFSKFAFMFTSSLSSTLPLHHTWACYCHLWSSRTVWNHWQECVSHRLHAWHLCMLVWLQEINKTPSKKSYSLTLSGIKNSLGRWFAPQLVWTGHDIQHSLWFNAQLGIQTLRICSRFCPLTASHKNVSSWAKVLAVHSYRACFRLDIIFEDFIESRLNSRHWRSVLQLPYMSYTHLQSSL